MSRFGCHGHVDLTSGCQECAIDNLKEDVRALTTRAESAEQALADCWGKLKAEKARADSCDAAFGRWKAETQKDIAAIEELHTRAKKAEAALARCWAKSIAASAALNSIANNTCCGPCREAALVAQAALKSGASHG